MKSPRIYAAHSIQTSYFTPNTLCRAHNLMYLHTSKVQNHNASTSKTCHFDTYPNPNSPCAHLFLLIIFESISHIYAVHTTQISYFIHILIQDVSLSFYASSHLYSKFRYLIKSTRDPINISQTVHFFTSSYLECVKSLRLYTAHTTQTSYFIPKTC